MRRGPNARPMEDRFRMARTFRYKDIQLAQLRSFCLAARERNFTTAARQLKLSASTVWEQLRSLERMLGCVLLQREGRSIELTAEGRILLEILQPHVEAIDSLKRLFDAGRAQLSPRLVIASSQYLLRFHLPRPIQEFTRQFPTVELNIQLPAAAELVTAVAQHQADIAVCAYDPEDVRPEVLVYEPIVELPLMLLTAKKHPLSRKRIVTLADLQDDPVILPAAGSVTRRLIDRLLQRHDLAGRLRIIMETPMFDTTQQYVEMGVGVGLMHLNVSPKLLPGIHVRPVEESRVPLSIAMVVRRHGNQPQTVHDFQQIVRSGLGSAAR